MPKSLNSVPHTGGSVSAMHSDLTLIKAGTGILTKSDDGTLDRADGPSRCRWRNSPG